MRQKYQAPVLMVRTFAKQDVICASAENYVATPNSWYQFFEEGGLWQ